jgi:5-(carboxyamino)imidazole ribonucleotide synthase
LVESDSSSAAQVVVNSPVGKASDTETIKSLVTGANVLTFEHEHVPGDFLRELISQGVSVQPHPDALLQAQDKIIMRERLTDMGLPCPAWRALDRDTATATTQLHEFIAQHGPDVVVKTSRGGYDGKGVRVVSSPEEVNDWFDGVEAGGPALLVEEKVPFSRELAVLVARRPAGDAVTWPVVESIQENGVCAQVIAPAPNLTQDEADRARETRSDSGETNIFINELAMRPHNSGHWTITGSVTSQFEQHLRAVLDLPLGDTAPLAPWTVMANILGSNRETLTDALPQVLAQYPNAKVNLYGKEPRPGRKLGHVNVSGSDLEQVLAAARGAAALVRDQD